MRVSRMQCPALKMQAWRPTDLSETLMKKPNCLFHEHFHLLIFPSSCGPAAKERGTMLNLSSALRLEQGMQTAGISGGLQNLRKFNNQDFEHLRSLCLSQGLLFEDDTFPAHSSSIGHNLLPKDELRQIEWKRPTELMRKPYLILDGVSRFDIIQGEIGDCWMLAALGSLTMQKRFLENVLPKDQGFQSDYAGIFHFRFWQFGEWVDVVIDDRLPFLNGNYLSVHPRTSNEFWPSLLEKAYAKLLGSYQNLHGGYISDALVDFTGGVQMQFSLKDPPPDLEDILKAASKSGCLMGCSTSGRMRNTVLRNGIVQGHAYTVTGAVKIQFKNHWEHIIRVWNPWGHGEWKGPWSDGSPEWDYVEPEIKEELYRKKNDGEFWMSCESFREQFSWLYVCNCTPTFLDFRDQPRTGWSVDRHINLLATGRNYWSSGAGSKNPQYFFKVTNHDPKSYNVVISLIQKNAEGTQDAQKLKIGFLITTENSRVLKQDFSLVRDVSSCFSLSPGTYAVIPATTEGREFEFVLRIFIKNQDYNENSDTQLNPMLLMDVPRQIQDSSYKAIFLKYAKQGSAIDALQLQQLLNDVVLQDEMASLGGEFSFDSCRAILALMDLNSNGQLTLQEFGSLWRSVTKYMDLFRREDKNHSGFLDVSELKSAIQAAGLPVNEQILRLMTLRYGDVYRRMGFADFVSCMLRLETMTYAFQNLAKDGPQVLMTMMEWLTLVMYI
ncbi:calpain-13-like isoform X3 [Coturnix japonica]|uniref:calpain-13-like isoform X3 n=1 Tax=Coturnix japonica TaxID=93934 RepID=UPI000777F507|nr:calpain-13-like isoform X3 [Coturnix japonica]